MASPVEREKWGVFKKTFKAMSDWGDDFERKHFDGDFLGAVVRVPKKASAATGNTLKAISNWSDDFERRHFEGDFVGAVARASAAVANSAGPVEPNTGWDMLAWQQDYAGQQFEEPSSTASSSSSWPGRAPEPGGSGGAAPASPAAGGPAAGGLWAEAQHLREELAEERERRRGRAAALLALDDALRPLRAEVALGRRSLAPAEQALRQAEARAVRLARPLAELRRQHATLLTRSSELERELGEFAAAAAAEAAREARHEQDGGHWAREGPEIEALKEATVELAEALAQLDAARLERRKELAELHAALEAAQAENAALKQDPDAYVAPGGSLRASLRRLLTVAVGKEDPFADLEQSGV